MCVISLLLEAANTLVNLEGIVGFAKDCMSCPLCAGGDECSLQLPGNCARSRGWWVFTAVAW